MVQWVKSLPAVQDSNVGSLAWKDPLEKEMATHSSILAWRIPWAEEPDGLQFIGLQKVEHHGTTNTFTFTPSPTVCSLCLREKDIS